MYTRQGLVRIVGFLQRVVAQGYRFLGFGVDLIKLFQKCRSVFLLGLSSEKITD